MQTAQLQVREQRGVLRVQRLQREWGRQVTPAGACLKQNVWPTRASSLSRELNTATLGVITAPFFSVLCLVASHSETKRCKLGLLNARLSDSRWMRAGLTPYIASALTSQRTLPLTSCSCSYFCVCSVMREDQHPKLRTHFVRSSCDIQRAAKAVEQVILSSLKAKAGTSQELNLVRLIELS